MPGVCIGLNFVETETCTDAMGEYAMPDLKEKVYMFDVGAVVADHRQGHMKGFQFTFVKVVAEPELRVPDLTIDWYVVCGTVESALIRNMVGVGGEGDGKPMLPSQYTVEVYQGADRVKEYQTAEQFCVMVALAQAAHA